MQQITYRMGAGGRGISADTLKLIAIITMAVDHTGYALFPQSSLLRMIGRIAFPIFMWLLVQGFVYTSDRGRYLLRMGVFALLSEYPFDLLLYGRPSFTSQNVYFTLFFCLLLFFLLEKAESCGQRKTMLQLTATGAVMVLTFFLQTDYGGFAPLLAVGMYRAQRQQGKLLDAFVLFLAGCVFDSYLNSGSLYLALDAGLFEFWCLPALWLIEGCNGRRSWKRGKYLFYLFYPLHMLLLYGVRIWLFG